MHTRRRAQLGTLEASRRGDWYRQCQHCELLQTEQDKNMISDPLEAVVVLVYVLAVLVIGVPIVKVWKFIRERLAGVG